MKKLIITILSVILFTTLAIAQDEYVEWAKEASKVLITKGYPDFHGLIVKEANKNWPDDYEMIAYEIKEQCKAWYTFYTMKKPIEIPEGTFEDIRTKAVDTWSEYKKNSDGMLIFTKCDWVMIIYEMENQIEAYFEIF